MHVNSSRLLYQIGSLTLEDKNHVAPPTGDINGDVFTCFKPRRECSSNGMSSFQKTLIVSPNPVVRKRRADVVLPVKSARTVIDLQEKGNYWSVDENGVVTTEEFCAEPIQSCGKKWVYRLLEFIALVVVFFFTFAASTQESANLENWLWEVILTLHTSLRDKLNLAWLFVL